MTSRASVSQWLDRYVAAWKSYDGRAIGALFSENALYYYSPFLEPVEGRNEIVKSWLEDQDEEGSFSAQYQVVAVDGDVAVANGRTEYYEDGEVSEIYDNVFILRFNSAGECTEYREWYMEPSDDDEDEE